MAPASEANGAAPSGLQSTILVTLTGPASF
jgi:hypothetical protein